MIELIGGIDLERYMGDWYEMARKPAFFQRSCVRSSAKYELEIQEGRPIIKVINHCVKENGKESEAIGKAQVKGERQFSVKFSIFMNLFNHVNYEIFFIDRDYEVAIVGSPNREYLWILSRKILPRDDIENLLVLAKERGFEIDDVIFDMYS